MPFCPRTEVPADARYIAGRIIKHLWIIFVALPFFWRSPSSLANNSGRTPLAQGRSKRDASGGCNRKYGAFLSVTLKMQSRQTNLYQLICKRNHGMKPAPTSTRSRNDTHGVGPLRNKLPHRNKLRLAPSQASNLLERRLFLRAQGVGIVPGLIKPVMGAAKFVTARISRD